LSDLKRRLFPIIIASFILMVPGPNGNFSDAKTLRDSKMLPNSTGRPLPRFVSLRATVVNLRTGPGVRYPVDWVYERKYLPIEVIAEFDNWRKIRDVQGTQGWIHQSMLSSRRMFIIISKMRTLRKKGGTKSLAVAKLATNVIGELKRCPAALGWCEVSAGGFKGWLRRVDFWGVYAQETIK
jgi:SH3-like domain-containing protein